MFSKLLILNRISFKYAYMYLSAGRGGGLRGDRDVRNKSSHEFSGKGGNDVKKYSMYKIQKKINFKSSSGSHI